MRTTTKRVNLTLSQFKVWSLLILLFTSILFAVPTSNVRALTGPRIAVITNVHESNSRTRIREALEKLFGGPGSVILITDARDNPPGCACVEFFFPFVSPVYAEDSNLKKGVKEAVGDGARDGINSIGDATARAGSSAGIGSSPINTVARGTSRAAGDVARMLIAGSGRGWPDRWELTVAVRGGCPGDQRRLAENDAVSLAMKLDEDDGMLVAKKVGQQQDKDLHDLKNPIRIARAKKNQQLSEGQIALAIVEVMAAYARSALVNKSGAQIPMPAGDKFRAIYERSRQVAADVSVSSDVSATAEIRPYSGRNQTADSSEVEVLRRQNEALNNRIAELERRMQVPPSHPPTITSDPVPTQAPPVRIGGPFYRPLAYIASQPGTLGPTKIWVRNDIDARGILAAMVNLGMVLGPKDDLVLGPKWSAKHLEIEQGLVSRGVKGIVADGKLEGQSEYDYWNGQYNKYRLGQNKYFDDPASFAGRRSEPPPKP